MAWKKIAAVGISMALGCVPVGLFPSNEGSRPVICSFAIGILLTAGYVGFLAYRDGVRWEKP